MVAIPYWASVTLDLSNTRVDARELEKSDDAKEGVVCVVVVLTLAGVLTASALYLSFWPSDMDSDESGSTAVATDERLCQGSQCASAAETLKTIMKADEDPCHNFYRFVCGNYHHPSGQMLKQMENDMYAALASALNAATFPPTGQSAAEKAAALYDSCTHVRAGDVDDTTAVAQLMKDVGLTATTHGSADALDKIVMLFFQYSLSSVLELSLMDKRLHRAKRVLGLALNPALLSWFSKRGGAGASFYPRHLGPFGLPTGSTEAADTAGRIIGIENEAMEELLMSKHGEQHGDYIYAAPALNGLVPCTSHGSWEALISKYSGSMYGSQDEVLVKQPDMSRFGRLCKRLTKERLSLLTAWDLLRTLMPLSSPNVAVHYNAESGSHMCLLAVARAMEVPLLSWYIFKEVPQGTVSAAKALVNYMRKSALEEIDASTWLDGATKRTAINKVHTMRAHVGYPSYFGSPKEIDRVYASYPDVGSDFLKPWLRAMQLTVQWMTKNHSSFWYSVGSTNAQYFPMRNRIVLPAPVLRMPLFSTTAPKAFTFGGLGGVVGHELTHAFDPVGSHWDGRGRKRDWWSAGSRHKYEERLGCLRHSHGIMQVSATSKAMATPLGGGIAKYSRELSRQRLLATVRSL